jgi:hypothetical protein
MIRTRLEGLSDNQTHQLTDLANTARPGRDVMFIDVVDNDIEPGGPVDEMLQVLAKIFDDYNIGLLNAFDPYEGLKDNLTPGFSSKYNFEFFGDFAIDRRYPSSGGGEITSVTLPHYHPNHQSVVEFEGDDFADAGEELVEWGEWENDHCQYCRDIHSMVQQGIGRDFERWKRSRQGHHIHTMLRGNI